MANLIAHRVKSGQGQFRLEVYDDGSVKAGTTGDLHRELLSFPNKQAAYDHYAVVAELNNSAWNICYHLEDFIGEQ